MKLIVGLGNPGKEYDGTRHNIGWELVDRLAVRLGLVRKPDEFNRLARNKFDGLAIDGPVTLASGGNERALLLKPTTYMNLSGKSVQAAMAFFQVEPDDVMVVLDDLALPAGKLRMRASGSSGGHNGLRDIERALGTNQYPRLRIGIDPKPEFIPQRDYVLTKFTPDQRKAVDPALDRATDAILAWMDRGVEVAMSQFNAEPETKKKSGSKPDPKPQSESADQPTRDA